MVVTAVNQELAVGDRFEFGDNWWHFLRVIDSQRIADAEASLHGMLETADLRGKTFLDAGSGSGLFSLAARRLGARVHSFDYDPQSVRCTGEMKRRFAPGDVEWTVEQGSVLDEAYMRSLGTFDIVYSWGVLHHTGAMWKALDHVSSAVSRGGKLYISIYNDQGPASRKWAVIKRTYCRSSRVVRWVIVACVAGFWAGRSLLVRVINFRNPLPALSFSRKKATRGMSVFHNLIDWVGGYPFEVARPEEVLTFCRQRGFVLLRMTTAGGGHGCNEYVFQRWEIARPEKSRV